MLEIGDADIQQCQVERGRQVLRQKGQGLSVEGLLL
jgi:hypothetical protein